MRNATLFVRLVFLASLTLLPCTGGSHFARRYFQLNVIPGSTVSTAAGLPLLDQRSDKAYDYKVDLEHLLRGDSNAADFAILLKNIASLRETVKLTQHHKQVLAQGLVSHLPEMTVSTFSSGIWALGTLGCSLTDLFPPYSSLVRNSTDQAAPLSTIPLNYDQFVEYISAFAASADSIEFMRLIVGLSKLGVTFQALPEAQRNQVYVLLENPELSARDLSTIIYSLGIMKGQIAPNAKQAAIPSDVVSRLLGHVESKLEQMSAQGFVNTLYGLSRIGVDWNAVSPCYGFIEAQVKTMSETPSYSAKEICSFVLSLAMMQVPMSSLPQSFREHLFSALDRIIPTLLPKEVANIIWALGKLRYQWRVQGRVGGIGEAATEAAHMLAVQSALTAQLVRTLPHSTVFDTESIITGLSFAQVHMEMLPPDTQQALQKLVSSHVNKMNIFCLCNVLCGLAKMKVKVPSAAGAQSFLNESLSAALLARTSHVFHTLLPEQFGPVMWALGMMGYTKTTIPVNTQQRMIAILSRVFQKLNSRAAAYSLWGLAKLSFVWSDLTVPYKSVADGIPGTKYYLFRFNHFFTHCSFPAHMPLSQLLSSRSR